jgi:hypothetical protein
MHIMPYLSSHLVLRKCSGGKTGSFQDPTMQCCYHCQAMQSVFQMPKTMFLGNHQWFHSLLSGIQRQFSLGLQDHQLST